MDRLAQLEAENGVLKERLYACHALGLPEVAAALAGHLDMMDVDVYDHRAKLQGALTQCQAQLMDAQTTIGAQETRISVLSERAQWAEKLARELWIKIHGSEGEPFPGVMP